MFEGLLPSPVLQTLQASEIALSTQNNVRAYYLEPQETDLLGPLGLKQSVLCLVSALSISFSVDKFKYSNRPRIVYSSTTYDLMDSQ